MKYLIVGLGNPGLKYVNTRHNIGYQVLDYISGQNDVSFSDKRYGYYSNIRYKSRSLVLIKPTTYMNLSGLSVNYYLKKEKVSLENLLIIVDDISLPVGKIRIKPQGSSGGHNGLEHIKDIIGTDKYPRLRVGISNEEQVNMKTFVLEEWSELEKETIKIKMSIIFDAIKCFVTQGIGRTMNLYNNK